MKTSTDSFFDGTGNYGAVGILNLSRPLPKPPPRTQSLPGYHVLLTQPYRNAESGERFELWDFERYTAWLSALMWQRCNGPIWFVTDSRGAEYLRKSGLEKVYTGVLPILDARNMGIDAVRYWASGKIQALTRLSAPCVLIDLDLIVWNPLDVSGCSLAVAHTEPLFEEAYPPPSFFRMSPRYAFPEEWDESALPLNTSLAYFGDDHFKAYYTRESVRFMQYERDTPNDGIRCMVFAEQRVLGMCAVAKGIAPKTYLLYGDSGDHQRLITHLWSAKGYLRASREARERYIALCEEKIRQLSDSPPDGYA